MKGFEFECHPLRHDKDKPQGQDHVIEMQPSDKLLIKCGDAELVVWPVGAELKRDDYGFMYRVLVIQHKHEKELYL